MSKPTEPVLDEQAVKNILKVRFAEISKGVKAGTNDFPHLVADLEQLALEAVNKTLPSFAKPGGVIPYKSVLGEDYVSLQWLREQLTQSTQDGEEL